MLIDSAKKEDALTIAKIHKAQISHGFLSSLSVSFLATFYQSLIESPVSFCLVARKENKVVGFISGTTNTARWQRYFLKHYFFHSLWFLLPKLFSLASVKKAVEALWYPSKESSLPSAELLTLAVDNRYWGTGVGAGLLAEFLVQMKSREVKCCRVVVGETLLQARRFYEKHGFIFEKIITIHGKEPSRVYTLFI